MLTIHFIWNLERNIRFIFIDMSIQRFIELSETSKNSKELENIVYCLQNYYGNRYDLFTNLSFPRINDFLKAAIELSIDNDLLNEESHLLQGQLIILIHVLISHYKDSLQIDIINMFEKLIASVQNLGATYNILFIKFAILKSFITIKNLVNRKKISFTMLDTLLNFASELPTHIMTSEMISDVYTAIYELISIDNIHLSKTIDVIKLVHFIHGLDHIDEDVLLECVYTVYIPKENFLDLINSIYISIKGSFSLISDDEFSGYEDSTNIMLQVLSILVKYENNYNITSETLRLIFSMLTKQINKFKELDLYDEQPHIHNCLILSTDCLSNLIKYANFDYSSIVDTSTNKSGSDILVETISVFFLPGVIDSVITSLSRLLTVLFETSGGIDREILGTFMKRCMIRISEVDDIQTTLDSLSTVSKLLLSQPSYFIDLMNAFNIEDVPAFSYFLKFSFGGPRWLARFSWDWFRALMEVFKLDNKTVHELTVEIVSNHRDIPPIIRTDVAIIKILLRK